MAKKKSTARRKAEKNVRDTETSGMQILSIDENRLEVECGNHALLYYQYATELAEARLACDTAKAELDVVSAELDAAIRDDPDAYDLPKLTEGSVKNCILLQGEYQTALGAYHGVLAAVRMLEALVKALEHRRSALKNLVELRLANYYAEPSLPAELKDEFEETQTKEIRSRGRRRRQERTRNSQ